jgi:uncharacterized delta-60 repeat protein
MLFPASQPSSLAGISITKLKSMCLLILVSLAFAGQTPGAGEVDTTFRASLVKLDSGHVYRSIRQPDGKIIIAGEFTVVGGAPRTNIARLNINGTVDPTFVPPSIVSSNSEPAINDIALQADGKVLVAGQFSRAVIRLNPDGSLDDTGFNTNFYLNSYTSGFEVQVLPDNRIIFAGLDSPSRYITILTPDGDVSLRAPMAGVARFSLQNDGKVLIYSLNGSIERRDQNLATDNTFTGLNVFGVNAIEEQPDGKIIIAGSFTSINGFPVSRIARLNSNGTLDASFSVGVAGPDGEVQSVEIEPGGKILIGGAFSNVNGILRLRAARLNSGGSLDTSFTMLNGFSKVFDLSVEQNGNIIVAGMTAGSGVGQTNITRVDSSGIRDFSFEGIVGVVGVAHKVVIMPDDKIVVGGVFNSANGVIRRSMARFNADGTLDTGFNQTELPINVFNFDVMPDGKLVISGFTSIGQPLTMRLNQDGSRDAGFPLGDWSDDIKALPDGKVLLGHALSPGLTRRNADGSIDSSFVQAVPNGTIQKITLQPDGRILIGGTFSQVNGVARSRIARLNANGTLDTSFDPLLGPNSNVYDIDVQSDGKIIVAGDFTAIHFVARRGVARLNPDGALDTTFDAGADNSVYGVKLQNDGRILVGGSFLKVDGYPSRRYSRLNPEGTKDRRFSVWGGADAAVNEMDQQSDGSVIMVGGFRSINQVPAAGIVRINNVQTAARTPFDFDGDGKADISVFRPGVNIWYILRSSDGVFTQNYFGSDGDIPVPADYDGDGKSDIGIFRLSSGTWWTLNSSNGSAASRQWGAAGDKPRPSDFDGDGRADFIVFRPSNGHWYRTSSSSPMQSNAALGQQDAMALVADFDGDGIGDRTVFRPSTGVWTYWASGDNGVRSAGWGTAGDIPAPADMDGDGRTDFVVYRPATGLWYVLNSRSFAISVTSFGLAEDKPVPADYDGDGKADIAVYRPSPGIWYLLRSTAGFTGMQFGISSDVPTENSFLY